MIGKIDQRAKPETGYGGPEPVAGNGLLDRRALLRGGLAMTGAALANQGIAGASERSSPAWMLTPGGGFRPYGMPSRWQESVQRILLPMEGFSTVGSSRTPLEKLEGTITPNGLHFERHHNGVPEISPSDHRLIVHGLVRRPLEFTLDALLRYPMETHVRFIECGGNSGFNSRKDAPQLTAGTIHGLLSCSEWTGVPLRLLLEEAGLASAAAWVLAEGADAAAMTRSVPVVKCLDDAIVALYQNGEALRPEQGYPMRLLLPGFEGNMNVKWLRRLKVVAEPLQSREETAHYTDLLRDGRARQFVFVVKPKSVILRPSYGLTMRGPGLYEISGLAWSGAGRVRRVEVSADRGKSWATAALGEPALPKALTRFRLPWMWDGAPTVLMSRAVDEFENRQPTRSEWIERFAPGQIYHCNAIQCWNVAADGQVSNVYA